MAWLVAIVVLWLLVGLANYIWLKPEDVIFGFEKWKDTRRYDLVFALMITIPLYNIYCLTFVLFPGADERGC